MKHNKNIYLFLLIIIIMSCNSGIQNGDDLSESDIEFIKGLEILDEGENIILFESHGGSNGIETSGNFISNRLLATYWIDDRDSNKTSIRYAYHWDIDTITTTDLSNDWSLSSYLTIKTKTDKTFNLHIGQNKDQCSYFFDEAMAKWRENKNGS